LDGGFQVNHVNEMPNGGNVSYEWVFSPDTMMPSALTLRVRHANQEKFKVSQRTFYTWEQVGAVNVPKSIRRTEVQSSKDPSGNGMAPFEVTDDFDFVWNSVNEDLEGFEFTKSDLIKLDIENFLESAP